MTRQSANRTSSGRTAAQAAERVVQPTPADEDASPARRSLDALLGRLDGPAPLLPRTTTALLNQAESDADEHAESLRVTLKAQLEAERLLSAASTERKEASAQAALILEEAKSAAERLGREANRHMDRAQKEAGAWAAEQRSKVEALVAELVESATEEAATIRKDALISAMAEAEEAAEQYLARSAARASRDADAIRAEAQSVLKRSRAVVAEATESVRTMALTLADFVSGLHEHAESVDALMVEAAARLTTSEPMDLDVHRAVVADGPDVDLENDEVELLQADHGESVDVEVGLDDGIKTSADEAAPKGQRRPLGSLFRGEES